MVRHARRRPCPRTQQNTATLPLRMQPSNVDKLHYATLGPNNTQLATADADVPAAQTTFGDTTTGSSATAPTQTKPTMRRPRQPRTNHTAAQPPLDRKQTTRKPANTKSARRARVETGTTFNGMGAPWCATPADHHAHERNRTPQLYHYECGQPTLTNFTTLHLDQPTRN